MRLLLLNPFQITSEGYDIAAVKAGGKYAEAPLGLGYLSSYCRKKNGIDVKIIDANIYAIEKIIEEGITDLDILTSDIMKQIKDYGPDIVGISCLFHATCKITHQFAARIKEMDRRIPVILGGCYPTASSEVALKDPNVDYIVLGEGERTLSELLSCLKGEKDISGINGMGYKENGRLVIKPQRYEMEEIDYLPFPDRDDFPLEKYSKYGRHVLKRFFTDKDKNAIIATMTATRGCPFNCSFCISKIFWNRRFRYRDPQSVLDEMELLVKEYKVTHISFNDDNFTMNRNFAETLFKGILERGIKVKWCVAGGMSLATLDRRLVELMLQSGCLLFNIAIESANPRILKKIHKPVSLKMVEQKLAEMRSFSNIYVIGFFMVGFPDETKEEFFTTLSYGKNLDLDWALFTCVQPYPGTELYNEAVAEGLISEDIEDDFEKLSWRHSVFKAKFLSREFIEEQSYIANLEGNFLNNRNLHRGDIEQAIRDFKWVVEMVPDHAVGYYTLYLAHKKKGDQILSEHYLNLARENMNKQNRKYFKELKIDIPEGCIERT